MARTVEEILQKLRVTSAKEVTLKKLPNVARSADRNVQPPTGDHFGAFATHVDMSITFDECTALAREGAKDERPGFRK